jgi:hypothetical protein
MGFEAIDFVSSPLLSSAPSQRLRLFPNDPPVGCDLLKSCHAAPAQNFEWVLLSLSTSVEREESGKLGSQLRPLTWLLRARPQRSITEHCFCRLVPYYAVLFLRQLGAKSRAPSGYTTSPPILIAFFICGTKRLTRKQRSKPNRKTRRPIIHGRKK